MFNCLRKVLAGAVLTAAMAAPVFAADLEPRIYEEASYGGWYLRGHVGFSNQRLGELDYARFDDPATFGWHDEGDFDSAGIFGVGFGYRFNEWFRSDLTVEYRGRSDFSALDFYDTDGDPLTTGDAASNDYDAKKSEWLVLANAYADFGDFHGIVPYLGLGVGTSRNTISNFTDTNATAGGGGYADSDSKWNFAWAVHAGLGFKATERLTIDLGYSYVDLGDAQTDIAYNFDGSTSDERFHFEDLTSHDFKIGLRFALN